MKKNVFVVFLFLLGACLTGCDQNVPECKYHAITLNLSVNTADWQFDENAQQFYFTCDVPEITPYVYNYGNWTVSREFGFNAKNAYQVALPMSIFCTAKDENNNEVYYTQHIDYRVGIGFVDIQLTNSDYYYDYDTNNNIVNPESMSFRLQLIY